MKIGLIVMFHEIHDPAWFEQTILLLKSKYSLVGLKHFEPGSNTHTEKMACHITFDDGHKSFYQNAFPILKKHNAPATLFVSPDVITSGKNFWFQEIEGYDQNILKNIIAAELKIERRKIESLHPTLVMKCLTLAGINNVVNSYQQQTNTKSKPPQNMNLHELIEVDKSTLVAIGGHTLNHPILKNETNDISNYEISGSIKKLEELLGHSIQYFAYPNGIPGIDFGKREIECLQKNNITVTVSTEPRYVTPSDHIYSLPRIALSHGSTSYIKLKLFLGRWWDVFQSFRHPTELKLRSKIYATIPGN